MSDDAAKREERRQRILARSQDRLSRLTNTGRGADYEGMAPTDLRMPARPKATERHDDPPEVAAGATSALSATPRAPQAAPRTPWDRPQQGDDADPFAQMLSAMQARGGDGSGAHGLPSDPMALLQQMMSGQLPKDGAQGAPPPQALATASPWAGRLRLIQAALVGALSLYLVASSIFSHTLHHSWIGGTSVDAHHLHLRQWASLAKEYLPSHEWSMAHDPSMFPFHAVERFWAWVCARWAPAATFTNEWWPDALSVSDKPTWSVFYVLLSMEIGLMGMRLAMPQPAHPPSSAMSMLSMYAPGAMTVVTPALHVLGLLSSLVDDVCILLFTIGLGVLFCQVWVPNA